MVRRPDDPTTALPAPDPPTDQHPTPAAGARGNQLGAYVDRTLAAMLPSRRSLAAALGVLAGGLLVSWVIYRAIDPIDVIPTSNYSTFVVLALIALVLERFLEPLAGAVLPSIEANKARRAAALTAATNAPTVDSLRTAEEAQREAARGRASRGVLMWAIASALGMLLAAILGIFLIRSVEAPLQARPGQPAVPSQVATNHDLGAKDPNRLLDLLLTGLVIGAGTKPIHGLVGRISVSSRRD
ncbi:MAG: hypothetical protein QOG53_3160 [Frankiales bacterium]|jgi:hypothetical protein|nr:hypothetical protein [Frankiales bacterium]